jgi:hypothetical protein
LPENRVAGEALAWLDLQLCEKLAVGVTRQARPTVSPWHWIGKRHRSTIP